MSTGEDIFEKVSSDHREAIALLDRLAETAPEDVGARRQLLDKLKTDLIAHEKAEQMVLLAAVGRDKDAELARHDNLETSRILHDLEHTAPDSQGWKERFTRLRTRLVSHCEQLEKNVFPKAREVIDHARSLELGRSFEFEKLRLHRQS